jgi:acyl-CoA thioester hydrolase
MNESSFTWTNRVRVYECDALGHVNNATYLCYLQQATAEAWPSLAPGCWELRRLSIEYLAPARSGDELAVQVWGAGAAGAELCCGYEIQRVADPKTVLRALLTWAPPEGAPRAGLWPNGAPEGCLPPKPLRPVPDRWGGKRFHWPHTVWQYELDSNGRAHPTQILHWLEEAKIAACTEAGWPLSRMQAEDVVIVQTRHDGELLAPLRHGDALEIVSRVYEMGRVRGSWRQEIWRGGQCAGVDDAAGAFLNGSGRLGAPPAAMLEALKA